MSTFVVFGTGRQGVCAAYDLLRHGATVLLIDTDRARVEGAKERLRQLVPGANVIAEVGDAAHPESCRHLLETADVVLSCVPYFLNARLAEVCVEAGTGFCDLGGNTDVSRRVLGLHERARARGVALVPDCGLAPGLGNTLAIAAMERIAGADELRVYCGGLPQTPEGPFGYHLVFSMDGLLNEYSGVAEVIRDGVRTTVPALDDVETMLIPGVGELEAFATSGGTATAAETLNGKIQSFEYKTLRYPGHIQMFRAYRDAGLLDEAPVTVGGVEIAPRKLLATLLYPRLERSGARDLIILRASAKGHSQVGTWDLIDRGDEQTGFSAMERCTAFPAAVIAEMIASGEVAPGAVPLETSVPTKPFLERLAKRGLDLQWSVSAAF